MRQISFDEEQERLEHLKTANLQLGKQMKGECLFIHSSMFAPVNSILDRSLESLHSSDRQDHLVVLLQTDGGSIEIVEQLVEIMRSRFQKVSFVVAGHAFSAGTILVLSGDEIFMKRHSMLGPIDPQFYLSDGRFFPGQGIIEELDQLRLTINSATDKEDVLAEIAMLQSSYIPAEVSAIRNAMQLSRTLLIEWLPKYKFKSWIKTKTRGIPVTDQMKMQRADEICKIFSDSKVWLSHGRGISMEKLTKPPLDLRINDYGKNSKLKKLIDDYFYATLELLELLEVEDCIHTQQKLWRF